MKRSWFVFQVTTFALALYLCSLSSFPPNNVTRRATPQVLQGKIKPKAKSEKGSFFPRGIPPMYFIPTFANSYNFPFVQYNLLATKANSTIQKDKASQSCISPKVRVSQSPHLGLITTGGHNENRLRSFYFNQSINDTYTSVTSFWSCIKMRRAVNISRSEKKNCGETIYMYEERNENHELKPLSWPRTYGQTNIWKKEKNKKSWAKRKRILTSPYFLSPSRSP